MPFSDDNSLKYSITSGSSRSVICFLSLLAYGFGRDFIFERSYSFFMSGPPIVFGFRFRGFTGRDDPDCSFILSVAVAHQKETGVGAQAQGQKTISFLRKGFVEKFNRAFIKKDRASLLKSHAVLFDVALRLPGVPYKLQTLHNYNVTTRGRFCQAPFWKPHLSA